jgi:hypothetical protein
MPSNTTHGMSRVEMVHLAQKIAGKKAVQVFTDPKKLEAEAAAYLSGSENRNGTKDKSLSEYDCVTEQPIPTPEGPPDPTKLWIGLFDNIPRWKRGSVVKFATLTNGFPKPGQAAYAASKLRSAAAEWNKITKDYVAFEWTAALEDAAFVLAYRKSKSGDGTLASAFFPNSNPINTLFVYGFAFKPENERIMHNVFLHELGHVLGLRHEFAPQEGGAVKWGQANESSVMAYKFPPTIQESDKKDLASFYEFSGSSIGGYPIKDFIPDN